MPANFKVFDFFDPATQVATSAKTLDTLTTAKIRDPSSVYSSIKENIDAIVNYKTSTLNGITLEADKIATREIKIAVPAGTTTVQWDQIHSAILYGESQGVKVTVTAVH